MEINEFLHKEIDRLYKIRKQQEGAYLKLTSDLGHWGLANLNSMQVDGLINILKENLKEFYK